MIPRHDPAATAKRIEHNLPDVRLIVVLRNPIDRANSALRHHQRRKRLPKNAKLSKIVRKRRAKIRQLGLVDAGIYAELLRPYKRRFGDRLLVLLHDDVVSNPQMSTGERCYTSARRRRSFRRHWSKSCSATGLRGLDQRAQPEERREMWPYFRDDVKKLQKIIGRNLSMWNPDSRPCVLAGWPRPLWARAVLERPPAPTGDRPGRTQYASAAHPGPDPIELKSPTERFAEPTARHVGGGDIDRGAAREHRLVTRVHWCDSGRPLKHQRSPPMTKNAWPSSASNTSTGMPGGTRRSRCRYVADRAETSFQAVGDDPGRHGPGVRSLDEVYPAGPAGTR